MSPFILSRPYYLPSQNKEVKHLFYVNTAFPGILGCPGGGRSPLSVMAGCGLGRRLPAPRYPGQEEEARKGPGRLRPGLRLTGAWLQRPCGHLPVRRHPLPALRSLRPLLPRPYSPSGTVVQPRPCSKARAWCSEARVWCSARRDRPILEVFCPAIISDGGETEEEKKKKAKGNGTPGCTKHRPLEPHRA